MVSGCSEGRLSAQRQQGCLLLSLGTNFMRVVPPNPGAYPRGLAAYFLQALMPPTPHPPPWAAPTGVCSTPSREMFKLMTGKARRHNGLKEGHHQLNGGRTIRLLETTFINGSGEEVTSHLQRRSNLQVPW